MKFEKKCQKRGIVILNALIAIVIVGLLGISLTSIYANMFSTLSAGRDASQAQQYAQIEGEYLKTQGYDNADSSVHDWKTMENLLGSDDGNLWESKVESVRDTETDDGNKLKIVKVSVRQKGDTTSRASYEVPLSSQGNKDGYIEMPDTSQPITLRQNDHLISMANGATWEYKSTNEDMWVSFTMTGGRHWDVTVKDPSGNSIIPTAGSIFKLKKGSYIRFQDTNVVKYPYVTKYYVQYN